MPSDALKDLAELRDKISNHNKTAKKNKGSDCDIAEAPTTLKNDDGDSIDIRNMRMWATNDVDYFATEKAVNELESGQYTVKFSDNHGIFFSKQEINLDDLMVLPDSNSETVLDTIEYFWNHETAFRDHGFLWKRGILLWGPPGSGKTSTVQQLSKQIVDRGGITIYCDYPPNTAQGLSLLRRIEPERPVVVILEDMDAIIQRHGESDLLAMLDGEHQTDNVVFVATTNYPEELDSRFINRPSRFDEIIKIGMPSAAARQFYLAAKNPRLLDSGDELQEWVDITEGFSIAHLKELIISIECFGKTLEEAHSRLKSMIDATCNQYANDTDSQFGFIKP